MIFRSWLSAFARGGGIALLALVDLCGCSAKPAPELQPLTCGQLKDEKLMRAHCIEAKDPAQSCLPYSRPERFSGIWVVGFETSLFFPGTMPPVRSSHWADTALRISPTLDRSPIAEQVEKMRKRDGPYGRQLSVGFIGRRSLCRFSYGHAASPNEVVVDRFLKVRTISADIDHRWR